MKGRLKKLLKDNPTLKKIVGVILIVWGILALFTPFTPGSWLAILGLQLLGIELLFIDRVKLWFERKRGLCYRGDIIVESLSDKLILKRVKIVSTSVEPVTPQHQTPWLSQWTIHTVEFLEKRGPKVAARLAESLKEAHPWYADFKNDIRHFIIFRNKIFSIDRTKPAEYRAAREYGLSIGIPAHQLDFDSSAI